MALQSAQTTQHLKLVHNNTQYDSNVAARPQTCSQYLSFSLGHNGFNSTPGANLTERLFRSTNHYPIKIYTLGLFTILSGEESVSLSSKGQHKPIEMLKALIALGSKDVGEIRLCEALWPDTDGDVAHSAFSVTLHRLRKLIGHDALHLNDSKLTLNPEYCWVDAWHSEELLNEINLHLHQKNIEVDYVAQLTNRVINIYNGPFLGNEDEQAWYIMFRERLHNKMLRSLLSFSHYLAKTERCEQALLIYQKGIELEPLAEEFYYQLMCCYAQHERKAEAISVYTRCDKILQSTLGVKPSKLTRELYTSLLN